MEDRGTPEERVIAEYAIENANLRLKVAFLKDEVDKYKNNKNEESERNNQV